MRRVALAWSRDLFAPRITEIMDLYLRKLCVCIVLCLALTAVTQLYAHGHRRAASHEGGGYEQAAGREEKGGEASGQIAAWLFGIANFPVLFSIILKGCAKAMPHSLKLKEAVGQINGKQKRHLMKLHYWLNPVAIGVAIIHFLSTKCEATAIPELGLGMMLLICILGLLMTFRLSPAFMRKAVFRLHTSPIVLMAGIAILMIGHSMIE